MIENLENEGGDFVLLIISKDTERHIQQLSTRCPVKLVQKHQVMIILVIIITPITLIPLILIVRTTIIMIMKT